MTKTLLFIQGIYDTIDLFIAAFSDAFRQLGCICHVIDVREKETAMQMLKKIIEEEKVDGVVTFNNIGYNLSFTEGRNIWEDARIPYFNILMDHPFHYAVPLENAPGTSVVFCTDRNHIKFLQRFYPHLGRIDFMPHAGMEADISEYAGAGQCHLCMQGDAFHPDLKERPIDVLYAGGLSKYVAEGLVPDLGEIREFDAFALTKEVLYDLMQHSEKTTEDAVEEYFVSLGKDFTDQELNFWITELRFIDSYATSFYREQAVRLLVENGIKTTVFGGGWDRCEWADNPNLIYGGKVLAPQILELMNHSKIVLNTMTWYKNGMHDRIINGMLAKSVVVTDESEYLKEGFLEKEQKLVSFPLSGIENLPDLVNCLFQSPKQMQQIAEKGYHYAKAHHTWMQRAQYLLENHIK